MTICLLEIPEVERLKTSVRHEEKILWRKGLLSWRAEGLCKNAIFSPVSPPPLEALLLLFISYRVI